MVIIAGAGPGDPGLMTLKLVDAIKTADAIVYDRLIPKEALNYRKEDAELIYAGKEGGNHTLIQEQINELLLDLSKKHERVLRLKGGEPFVFGRGMEEILFLAEHGVKTEYIPGISSSIAGPGYAGIPVTHRNSSKGFTVITGHEADDDETIDYKALVALKHTIIILMGLKNLPEIVNKFLEAGMKEDTRISIIEKATTEEQRVVSGPITEIVSIRDFNRIEPPALVVVHQSLLEAEKFERN